MSKFNFELANHYFTICFQGPSLPERESLFESVDSTHRNGHQRGHRGGRGGRNHHRGNKKHRNHSRRNGWSDVYDENEPGSHVGPFEMICTILCVLIRSFMTYP